MRLRRVDNELGHRWVRHQVVNVQGERLRWVMRMLTTGRLPARASRGGRGGGSGA